jgi:hypothetical protein
MLSPLIVRVLSPTAVWAEYFSDGDAGDSGREGVEFTAVAGWGDCSWITEDNKPTPQMETMDSRIHEVIQPDTFVLGLTDGAELIITTGAVGRLGGAEGFWSGCLSIMQNVASSGFSFPQYGHRFIGSFSGC